MRKVSSQWLPVAGARARARWFAPVSLHTDGVSLARGAPCGHEQRRFGAVGSKGWKGVGPSLPGSGADPRPGASMGEAGRHGRGPRATSPSLGGGGGPRLASAPRCGIWLRPGSRGGPSVPAVPCSPRAQARRAPTMGRPLPAVLAAGAWLRQVQEESIGLEKAGRFVLVQPPE